MQTILTPDGSIGRIHYSNGTILFIEGYEPPDLIKGFKLFKK